MATSKRPARAGPIPKPGRSRREPTGVRFFRTQAAWRAWLQREHARQTQLWVGFWRVATGKPSITWPQSVDEALCFGWIDGLRKGLGAESYAIRFTPRSSKSVWSRVNLKRFSELAEAGLVRAAGRAARELWDENHVSGYSYESVCAGLDAARFAALRSRSRAWRFFSAQTPSYQRTTGHWVMSAKQEATRARRFLQLLAACEAGRAIPPLAKWVKVKSPGG